VLGRGAYAAVYRAKCEELPCAAKILHGIFNDEPALVTLQERFYQECEHLKNIRHPNIVQYLGLCHETATNKPVMLMELMDHSLTSFLETSTEPLSFSVQLHLCNDIALALAHLHTLGIIHRDLSSNNVLLIGPGSRAKVSDFGMSKVVDASTSRRTTPLTMVPGTAAYMPQEALEENPLYTETLDCFSFGVLIIQIITRLFPNPLPRKRG
jgi:serine/threonine protein kinase